MRWNGKKREAAFALVELMVAIAIISLALGAIYSVFASVTKSSTGNEVSAQVLQNLRTSLGFMEQDIRMAGLDRFATAHAGVEEATETSFRFTADRNMDGLINEADLSNGIQEVDLERITYSFDAANQRLRQCLSEGTPQASWDTVADHVVDLRFQYFDKDETLLSFPITDLTAIRSVMVSLTIRQASGFHREVTKALSKKIFCRNLSM
jgi:type II secretion system protein J